MISGFRLPDLGEGLPEAELVQWLVAEGEEVALNQVLAEVETAKAVVELPSPHAGRVATLHAAAGDVIAVGSVIVSFELDAPASPPADDAAEAAEAPQPHLVGYGAAPASGGRPQRRRRAAAGRTTLEAEVVADAPHDAVRALEPEPPLGERPRSTPPVRKLAKDLGVDLRLVTPTGGEGLITRADVEQFAERVAEAPAAATPGPAVPAPAAAADDDVTRIPVRGVRRFTAQAMVQSAFTAPHATVFLTVDVTETMRLLGELRDDRRLAGHRIGILAVAAKAACLALAHHPMLNARWRDDEIVQFRRVHLGIAAATERGLVVPNIKDAGALTLVELADAIVALAETARAGRTEPSALSGGTFSITNVGVFGVDAGTPILNPGEAGILALGSVRRLPWEHEGQVALREVLTLSLSFDHRLVDGEQGARFLADVAAVLRQPGRAMLLR